MKKSQLDSPMPKSSQENTTVLAVTSNVRRNSKPRRPKPKPSDGNSIDPATAGKSADVPLIPLGGVSELRRSRLGTFVPASFEFTVRPFDIAGGVEQLHKNGQEASWMVFLFDTAKVSKATDDQCLALQYSIIDGRVGLDWVLVGARNVADALDVAALMRHRGHEVERLEMNQVEFLRVEDGDLAVLGASILETLYGVPPNAELGLLVDGIVLSTGKRTIL